MSKKIKWGIIGLGKIAHTFAGDLLLNKNAELSGVASRDIKKATAFGRKYRAKKAFGSYEELASSPDIDVIYIATPHTFHFENTMLCLKNGKSVLCEKPMGINRGQVETMINEAKKRQLFLMEAMWTRFIPATTKVLDLIKKNTIGQIINVRADFGYRSEYDASSRIYNKSLGGGSLLDIGIYPIYLSLLTLGIPIHIKAKARMAPTGVDISCAMLFDYNNSAKAILESTVEEETPIEGWIYGSKGAIKMHSRFHHTETISVYSQGKIKETYKIKYKGNGYFHEIEEVHKCLTQNLLESPLLPHQVSLDLITIIDKVKDQIGLHYPNESAVKA